VRLPDGWWPPAALVAAGWLVAAGVASWAGDSADAPTWLLLVDQLILLPAGIVALYAAGLLLGGRLLAAWAGAVLVLLPLAGWAYALAPYRDTYLRRVLVEAVGVADGGRFAAASLAAVAGALALYATREEGMPRLAAAAGLAAGAAVVVEPAAILATARPLLALAVARRPGGLAAFGLPVAAAAVVALVARDAGIGLDVSWDAFSANMAGLREYTWSNRVLQWLPLAGTIGLARVSRPAAALAAGWLAAFVLAEAASADRPVRDGSFFLALLPALPALALLVAAIPLLVPGLPARLEAEAGAARA
jgi:hypothetical protein